MAQPNDSNAPSTPPQQPFPIPQGKIHVNSSSDYNYLVHKWVARGWQNGCVLGVPVLMVISSFRKRKPVTEVVKSTKSSWWRLSKSTQTGEVRSKTLLEKTLRYTWQGGLGGAAIGGGLGAARYYGMDKRELRKKRIELQFAEKNLRRDGLATIGGVLTSVLITALFWNKAPLVDLILGGSGIGTITGVASAVAMAWNEPPGAMDSTDTREKEAAVKAGIVKPGE
ncbi:hypothetical protein FRC16_000683 [Serendipita sp. 398]|nr:hypothetical protein FRC16_000683 [Serendipita sp. 398]